MIDDLKSIRARVLATVSGEHRGLILFGSHARGDATAHSDVDVLQVAPIHSPSYRKGSLHFSVYTRAHLSRMAAKGSLFVRHMIQEAQPLDSAGSEVLEWLRAAFVAPRGHADIRKQVGTACCLLDVPCDTYQARWRKFHALVVHLLRTALYATAQDRGLRTFSIGAVEEFFSDERIAHALALRRSRRPAFAKFQSAVAILEEYSGGLARNPHGSLEAFIVNALGESELTVILGLRLLHDGRDGLPYEELETASHVVPWSP